MRGLFLMGVVLFCVSASAQTDLQSWRKSTLESYNGCAFNSAMGIMFGDELHYKKTVQCVDQSLPAGKAATQAVLVNAKPAVAALVRDYYAVWSAALTGLKSLQYGREADNDRAHQEAKRRMAEIWAQIELAP